ncbi:hypothetical protein [Bacillus cereus]|uniref:hypothetical protein n=1 Tax=Bacillus cereus TaxID=1396 RepID=UPI00095283BF|nr:hypothetical protein [Bacillus cereus]OLR27702.1 hypothetical protein BLD50_00145 [Bacillus cereus]
METSYEKPQANTEKTNNQRNPPHFLRIALFLWKALQQAYFRQKSEDSVLPHSNRGSQYASLDYQNQLK